MSTDANERSADSEVSDNKTCITTDLPVNDIENNNDNNTGTMEESMDTGTKQISTPDQLSPSIVESSTTPIDAHPSETLTTQVKQDDDSRTKTHQDNTQSETTTMTEVLPSPLSNIQPTSHPINSNNDSNNIDVQQNYVESENINNANEEIQMDTENADEQISHNAESDVCKKDFPTNDSDVTKHSPDGLLEQPLNPSSLTSLSSDENFAQKPQIHTDKPWFNLQFHDPDQTIIKKPDELAKEINEPNDSIDMTILDRVQGSIIGMALGDALGAHVEFRPHQYLLDRPVTDLESGGTWGLSKGQFTDDTSMALCLANSLIACHGFNPYDQLVRYKWWFHHGYMSSTGHCFDIGAATSQSLREFERRQKIFAKKAKIPFDQMDNLSDYSLLQQFDAYCSEEDVAGNGALMRLTPVPLFFYRLPQAAVEYSGVSGQITHGDQKAYDACRYYGALIVAALHGYSKDQLLDNDFYPKHKVWFGERQLHADIELIAKGSYKKKDGYKDGIRGKGYIVSALEAALWAFWSDDNSFEKGALLAVNLGDDTDTTAAIYGQLAGAHYGYQKLPEHWLQHAYAKEFMEKLSKWIVYEGACWQKQYEASTTNQLTASHI